MLAKQKFPTLLKVLKFWAFLYILHDLQCAYCFNCNNGESIADRKLCDTKLDCSDGSDETFEVCFWNQCPNKYRCAYGACFTDEQECDGIVDCHDGTDEYWQRCSDFEENQRKNGEMQSDCPLINQIQCKESKECIPIRATCDGAEDCRDGSDETFEMCLNSLCPFDTFRCAYGGCIPKLSLCDHRADCRDSSDEIPSICQKLKQLPINSKWTVALRPKHVPKPTIEQSSYYPEIAQTEGPSKEAILKGCRVPPSDNTLIVNTLFNTIPYNQNQTVPHATIVRLRCVKNYALRGEDVNACLNGSWQGYWPECVRTCKKGTITQNVSIKPTCTYRADSIDCSSKDIKLVVGTRVTVECAPAYISQKANQSSAEWYCHRDGNWQLHNTTIYNFKCIPDCGIILPTVQQTPWVVSLFQRDSANLARHNFKCFGVIMTPTLILTHKDCVLESIKNQLDVYTIVEGNHTVSFNNTMEHAYTLYYLESLSIHTEGILAYLSLINPLIFSAQVRPVCFREEYSTFIGEPFAKLNGTDNKYYLHSIVDPKRDIHSIDEYRSSLFFKLKKNQIKF
ncbi:modular serine protease-like [Drosophila tropicalis]|uniref:modular serine protease-like n=1 Tax=Drosophila tropicalis TaxID=46794 RepID=UPI0035ABDED9